MSLRRLALGTLLVGLALGGLGCVRDLTTPPPPAHGKVRGLVDPSGKIPASDNPVTLVAQDGSKLQQTSGADGSFVFADVLPGTYYLDLKLPGFAPLLVPSIVVRSGQDVDLGTEAPAWLGGTSSEGLVDGVVVVNGGGDANGGQVEFLLQPVNQRVALAAVGVGGIFTQRVPPGTYNLRVSHPLYVTAEQDGVVVGDGQTLDLSQSPIALDLNPARLTGTVLEERDGLSAVPAAGALVTLSDGATTSCDANGDFVISGLPAGTQTMRVAAAGYHDLGAGRVVQLFPGQATALPSTITLGLDRGTIAGTVQISDQQPATDVEVAVTGTAYTALVSADPANPSHGSFQIQGVPAGVYEVSASKTKYTRATAGSVTVVANQTQTLAALTLAPLLGDFEIDDADPTNAPGYAASPSVTLNLSGFSGAISYRASEDPSFGGVAFSPFTGSTQPFTLSGQDGTHTVYAQYMDASNTVSATFNASIVLDTSAPAQPSTVIDSNAPFTASASPLYLTLQAQDPIPSGADTVSGLAAVRINETGASSGGLLDASPVPYQRDLPYLPTSGGDGPRTIYVQFVDHAGNASAIVSSTITVDTQAPSGSIAIADGAGSTAPGLTRTPMVALSATAAAEPNGGFVLIRLANSQAALATAVFQPLAPSSTWFLDASGDGAKTVWAELQDAAGNRTVGALSANVTLDTTPPSPAQVTLAGAPVSRSLTVDLDLSASDAVGLSPTEAVTVSLDPFFLAPGTVGPEAFPFSSQLGFDLGAGEPDGPKQIYVRYRDAAGNDTVTSARVTLDTTPPSGTMTLVGTLADGAQSSTSTAITSVLVQLTQSGATRYALGDETLTDCSTAGYQPLNGASSLATALSGSASPREVHLCLSDDAGNTFGPLVQTIALDTSAPTGCALALTGAKADGSPAPAGKTATAHVTATLSSCTETPAEIALSTQPVTCTANGAFAWQPYSAALPAILSGPDGTNTLYGCVRDAARNTGSLGSGSITLATQPPVGSLTLDSGAAYVNAAAVAARGGQIASAFARAPGATEWALSETGTPTSFVAFNGSPVNFTFSAGDGPKQLYAVFRDDVGNLSPVVSATIAFDTQPPDASVASVSVPGNGFTASADVAVGLAGPTDAVQLQLANAASAAACAVSDFNPVVSQPFALSVPFTVSAGDGLKRLCARVFDAAGNPSAIFSTTITLDTAAPTGCALALVGRKVDGSAAPAGKTAAPTISANVSSCSEAPTDLFLTNAPSITCSNGAPLAWQPFNPTTSFTLPGPDGVTSVRGCVRDRAGNVGSIVPASIILDTQGPSAPQLSLDNGAVYVNAAQVASRGGQLASALGQANGASEWAISETSNPAGFVAFTGAAANFTFSAGDGLKHLYAVFRDDVGNTSPVVSTTITFDTAAPDVSAATVSVPAGAFTGSPSVSLALSGPSDAAQLQLANAVSSAACAASDFSAAPTQAFTVSAPFTLSNGDGLKRVCARVLDGAGNPSAIFSTTLTLDTVVPTGCALSLAGRKVDGSAAPVGKTATPGVTANVSGCSETPADLYLTNAGSVSCSAGAALAWQPFSASSGFTVPGPDGVNTVRGCVRDRAGNVGSLTAGSITLDTQPPVAPLLTIDNGALYVNAAQVASRGGNLATVTGTASGATEWALQQSSNFTAASYQPFPATSPRSFTFAGTGSQTVYAVFRDDVGNSSAVASASITFDVTPPDTTAASLSIVSPTGNGYTNSVSALLQLVAPADATQVVLAEAANPGGCVPSDVSAITPRAVAQSFSFLLPAGDGPKRVCAQLFDAAGNPSSILPAAITLDTTPPSAPFIQTQSTVRNLADNSTFQVNTVGPNLEPDFARYEQLGGKLTHWTTASTNIGTTQFDFNVVSSSSASAGVANVLRLRAVDRAGNASPESSVVITTDVVAPQPVTLSLSGVTNKDSAGAVFWLPNPANTDVASYNVYYGSASGAYSGTYATEGNSPLRVGSTTNSLSLSGLANGAITYVTVRPVDFAGNEGPSPGYPAELQLQPNKVAPTQIAQFPLQFAGKKVIVVGDYAYVLGPAYYWNCGASPTGPTGLEILDLSGLVSPVQHGQLDPSVQPPQVVTTLSWNDGVNCDYGQNVKVDLVADGPWVFIASGTTLHMLNVSNPRAPVEAPAIDLSAQVSQITALTLDGTTLFLHALGTDSTQSTGKLLALDVSSLSDGSSGTTPTMASVLGPVHNTFSYPSGAAVTRNWLVQGAYNFGGFPEAIDLTNATDNNGGTPFDDTVRRTTLQGPSFNSSSPPVISGNLIYSNAFNSFDVYDVTPLWSWINGNPSPVLPNVASDGLNGGYGFEIAGGQALVANGGNAVGIATEDLTSLLKTNTIAQQSVYQWQNDFPPDSIVSYGPYLLMVTYYNFIALEMTSSTSFLLGTSFSHGANGHEIRGGLMYGSNGSVIDLQAGWPAPELSTFLDFNVSGGALLNDDRMLQAVSPSGGTQQLRVMDTTKIVDRNPGTSFNPPTDSYAVNLTGPTKLGEVKTYGNFAVVTEVLADGTYLEVFDIRKARNVGGGQQLGAGDSLGRFKVSSYTSATESVYLTLQHGRAFVSIDDTNDFSIFPSMPDGVVIYDLRPMIRDAARGPAVLQGTLPLKAVRQTAVIGNRLYAASLGNNLEQCYAGAPNPPRGFTIWDISAAMDEDDATTVTAAAPLGSLVIDQALSVTAYGSLVYLATNFANGASCVWGTYAIDVSDPTDPRIIGHSSVTAGQFDSTVSVHGSRLYLSGQNNTSIINLQ